MKIFINTLDTTPINWYLQLELRLIATDWEGMTQKFVTTFLFDSQYPSIDKALHILRQKCWTTERGGGESVVTVLKTIMLLLNSLQKH
jgi:hypothetical protein